MAGLNVVSTRKLTPEQKNMLSTSFEYQEYDAISISLLPPNTEIPKGAIPIFTSQNAVKACSELLQHKGIEVCCVGSKTEGMLREYPVKILLTGDKAATLAGKIVREYSERHFIHYCGNRRLEDLSQILLKNNIELEEEVVYHTYLNYSVIRERIDVVLVFSPSGVESYFSSSQNNPVDLGSNPISKERAICIGPTTAKEAQKYTEHIIMAKEPTVESVLEALNEFTIS